MSEIKTTTKSELNTPKFNGTCIKGSAKIMDKDGNFHVIDHASQNTDFIFERIKAQKKNNEKK